MEPETWRAARDLFERVVDLPPAERAAALAEREPEDAIRREAERLLDAEDLDDGFLEPPHDSPRDPGDPLALPGVAGPTIGSTVGPFRIERVLASGGMATVYEALQAEPARRVALKVMQTGLADEAARRRFRYESELLGRLSHPCIAQVYDAGMTTTPGEIERPWFALEFVENAKPLTAYAESHGLDLEARLRLLLRVASAVQHGHQRGVVHRDLKPGNVLVDDEGRVKVIDFGVARTISDEAEPDVERTREGEIIGTLRYMSPEQLAGRSAEVDARADVYALGVLLYELIVRRPPFELAGLSLPELAQVVIEDEPRPPSTVRTELPVDLDWVCARAMAKEPDRRYAAASDLSADLERFLVNEPVSASPPSTVYQLRKFVARHRFGVVASAAFALALVLGLTGTVLGWRSALRAESEARDERELALAAKAEAQDERQQALEAKAEAQAERAEAVEQAARSAEMLSLLLDALESPAPRRAGREVTMLSFLEAAAARIGERFTDRPRLAGWMHLVVGRAYHGIGSADEAERHVRASIEVRRAEPVVPTELAESLIDLSVIARDASRLDESGALLAEARQLLEPVVNEDERAFLRLRAKEAQHALATDPERAEGLLGVLLVDLERALGPRDNLTLIAHQDLARYLHGQARYAEAEEHYRVALTAWVERYGPDHPEVLRTRGDLIVVLFSTGRQDDAALELEELLAAKRRVLGSEHPDTVSTLNNLASIYYLQQKTAQAAPLFREALAALEEQVDDSHPMLVLVRANLGTIEVSLGNLDAAEPLLRAAYDARLATFGASHDETLRVLYELGRTQFQREFYEEALDIFEEGLAAADAGLGRGHPRYARFEIEAARASSAVGRVGQARERLERMLAAYQSGLRSSEIVTESEVSELLAGLPGN